MMMQSLTIVIPCYNEEASLTRLHARLEVLGAVLRAKYSLDTTLIYVDDGSKDATLEVARTLSHEHISLEVLALSRNFGKEAALLAGLEASKGAVLFMDGDGQHPPELAETLIKEWMAGFDVVFTYKMHRNDESALKSLFVRGFYRLLNMSLKHQIPENAGDFRLLSARAADAVKQMPERNRFFKGLSAWVGFNQKGIAYEPAPRLDGQTKWSFWSLLGLSMEGLTAFSVTPLRLAALFGAFFAFTAMLSGVWIVVETLIFGRKVDGYPSLFAAITLIGGVQLLMIGILGEYIGKILSELKARPVYFIKEHTIKASEPHETPDTLRG
jgi:polyisoprenyl-phosphate glycosyltransferase